MTQPPEWVSAGVLVSDLLDRLGITYIFAGGVASIIHGEIRTTLDADLLADIQPQDVAPLIAALAPNFFLDVESIHTAIANRRSFNIIHKNTMFKVDIFLPKQRDFDRAQLERRVARQISRDPTRTAWVASPEDTILAKLEWYQLGGGVSERQWRDVLGMLKTQAGQLDLAYMRRTANTLDVLDLLEHALTGTRPPDESADSRQARLF